MRTIWILENIKKDEKFFLREIELICLIASVSNWKTIYPECKTVLYACPSVYIYLENLGILNLWDIIDVEKLSNDDPVDRKAFWAASKLKCIRSIEAPFVLMDCDLYFKRKCFEIGDLLKFDIVVNQIEEGANIYPSIRDRILRDTVNQYPVKYGWRTTHSPNVSFLYIKDEVFKNEYAKTAWEWMEDLSQKFRGDPELNGKYMIFCEQKLLKEISDLREMKMAALSHNFYFNERRKIEKLPDTYGTFFLDGTLDYLHLHNKKRSVITDKNLFLDVRSDIIQSIMDLKSFSTKLLYQILLKNKEIVGPLL